MKGENQDGTTDSSTVTEQIEEPQGTHAAGGEEPGEGHDAQVPFHEHPRWKQVHGELKSYKDLGVTPEQILELGREVQYYRDLDAKNKTEQRVESRPPTEEEQQAEVDLRAARAALEKVAPELKDVEALKQVVKHLEEQAKATREEIDAQAVSTLAALMTQNGLVADDQKVLAMAKRVGPIISDDPKLTKLYDRDPVACVTKAWEIFLEDFDLIASRRQAAKLQQKGASLSALPRGQQGGGSVASAKGSAPPATIDELFRQERGALTGKG